jgi:hypothetical protein
MSENKKLVAIRMSDDAPPNHFLHYTISFLCAPKTTKKPVIPDEIPLWKERREQIANLQALDVTGFRVYGGYVDEKSAMDDLPMIKQKSGDVHDVFNGKTGKVHPWNDLDSVETIIYDNKKMNDLEKTRREKDDKMRLLKRQMENETSRPSEKPSATIMRLRKKLYAKGKIDAAAFQASGARPDNRANISQIQDSIVECYQTDYLDSVPTQGLEYGLITFYSPRHIAGLDKFCYKIRGLFETLAKANERKSELENMYPNERIYLFPLGSWCPYTDDYSMDGLTQLQRLNYLMKDHLDTIVRDKKEFDDRTAKMISANEEQTGGKRVSRQEKRRLKKISARDKTAVDNISEPSLDGRTPEELDEISRLREMMNE